MDRRRNTTVHRIAACFGLVAMLASAAAGAQAGDAGLYLYMIPASRVDEGSIIPGNDILLDLYVPRPDRLAAHLASQSQLTVMNSAEQSIRLSAPDGATLKGEPLAAHLAASFVIDHDQPGVAELVNRARQEHGPEPSVEELVAFVDATILTKTYRKHFDLASQVARSREGDCTEHAVLLAALARATNRPARVVLGVMLLENEGNLVSVGHAWTEIHDGRAWHIADATRPTEQVPGVQVRYLPLLGLSNESAGYGMQLMELTLTQPSRVEIVPKATQPIDEPG